MTHASEAPADTTMMGIVHDALRRDLRRAAAALSEAAPPEDGQRKAIASHVIWLMEFLHGHHAGEDESLWPLIRSINPAASDLLDQMDQDHACIAPAIPRVTAAAENYARDSSPHTRKDLLAALAALDQVLSPHLLREEAEMMPVVSKTLTHAQWDSWNQDNFVKPKSMRELGHEGHWLIDSIDRHRYQVVTGHVSAVPRFILLHGFARQYRRACAARWGPAIKITPADT